MEARSMAVHRGPNKGASQILNPGRVPNPRAQEGNEGVLPSMEHHRAETGGGGVTEVTYKERFGAILGAWWLQE